jgi:hypothetical protein
MNLLEFGYLVIAAGALLGGVGYILAFFGMWGGH